MKKTAQLFLLLLFINHFSGKAQQYVQLAVDSSHWFTTPFIIMPSPPPYQYFEYYLLGDTTVSSVSYKKVYYRTEWSSNGYGNMTSNFSLYALLREDTTNKKIYTIPIQNFGNNCQLNQEVLLYDFNLQVGDTLKASNLCLLLSDKVITNITQGNTWLSSKTFQLQTMPDELYEGVGSYYGLFEVIEPSVSGPSPYLIDYCRGGLNNCKYLNTGIAKNKSTENVYIYPNPVLDYFTISSKENFEFEYQILSIDGTLIEKGRNQSNSRIYITLDNGLYIIEIFGINKDFRTTKKIIKIK
ncbi:MAG: hypothetical protein A3K10_11705 [Bacteroidetes bacterium RIFCSPLOWO2_12_FULL_31_6]|nr:MAG: hypothetical protein A3K10_11705 [Bacteroidetes bacterium RIFCSPLOWO2_12_FULL_31_6]